MCVCVCVRTYAVILTGNVYTVTLETNEGKLLCSITRYADITKDLGEGILMYPSVHRSQ